MVYDLKTEMFYRAQGPWNKILELFFCRSINKMYNHIKKGKKKILQSSKILQFTFG